MARVLIVAPSYDSATHITAQWAAKLENELRLLGHEAVLRAGPEALPAVLLDLSDVDQLVFYCHGDATSLEAQPTRHSVPGGTNLVDLNTVDRVGGRTLYAVACEALSELGTAYAALFPGGAFVGYAGPFAFHPLHAGEFEHVVLEGAKRLVDGISGSEVAGSLRAGWNALIRDFFIGRLRNGPDAFLAAFAAAENSRGVGAKP